MTISWIVFSCVAFTSAQGKKQLFSGSQCTRDQLITTHGIATCNKDNHDSYSIFQSKVSIKAGSVMSQVKNSRNQAVSERGKLNPIVSIVYCDAGFKPFWPVFVQCYQKAIGCSLDGVGDRCGPSTPQLLDLALEDGQTEHCTRESNMALLEGVSTAAVTPFGIPKLIAKSMTDQLAKGNDVLRLDVDVFLMQDPVRRLAQEFPDVDIISSPDCTAAQGLYCSWYRDAIYNHTHDGRDVLGEMGFMLNTGLIYIRSNPKTIALAQEVHETVEKGKTVFEQVAFNEKLVERECSWSFPEKDGGAHANGMPSPGGKGAAELLWQDSYALGRCRDGLKVIALTYKTATRSYDQLIKFGSMSFHPGGATEGKLKFLHNVSSIC